MESYEHLIISAGISPIAAWSIFSLPFPQMIVLCFLGIGIGVLIDLDHFLVQRLRDGNWKHLKSALDKPLKISTENKSVLVNPIPNWSRYLSHFVILATLPALLWLLWQPLGLFVYVMLGQHVACDVLSSYRKGKLGFD